MPGVPHGKACSACREQKKHCDKAKPACSRCARLNIPCVGAGVQRYKFVDVVDPRSSGVTAAPRRATKAAIKVSPVLSPPSDEVATLAREISQKLSVRDVRFDLVVSYGPALLEIPRRLGKNRALDASAKALLSIMSDLEHQDQRSRRSLSRYSEALSALQVALYDPETARASSTLLAINVIWICQSWVAAGDAHAPGHARGVLKVLEHSECHSSQEPSDKVVMNNILSATVFERALDPSIPMQPWIRRYVLNATQIGPEKPPHKEGKDAVQRLTVELPELMEYDPALIPSIAFHHQAMRKISGDAYRTMSAMFETAPPSVYCNASVSKTLWLYALYHSHFYLTISLQMVLNGILTVYYPKDTELQQEALRLSKTLVRCAVQASSWTPLGASRSALGLELAWSSTTVKSIRDELEEASDRYCTPLTGASLATESSFTRAFDKLRAEGDTMRLMDFADVAVASLHCPGM